MIHRRAVARLGDEHWLVLDGLRSSGGHVYVLHWLLADLPYRWLPGRAGVVLKAPAGPFSARVGVVEGDAEPSLVRGDGEAIRGFRARGHFAREPALSLDLRAEASSVLFYTVFGPRGYEVSAGKGRVVVEAGGLRWEVVLGTGQDGCLVRAMTGPEERMDVDAVTAGLRGVDCGGHGGTGP